MVGDLPGSRRPRQRHVLQPVRGSGRTDSGAAAGGGAVPGGGGARGPVQRGDTASRGACSFWLRDGKARERCVIEKGGALVPPRRD